MRTIAMLRISAAVLVFGAFALSNVRAAEEPDPINIPSANLKVGLTTADLAQIKTHAAYWVGQISTAESVGGVYGAREGVLADYNKYSKSLRYQAAFARAAAALIPDAMAKLAKGDRLISLKEINYSIVVSEMPQLTSISAMNALAGNENSAVRFLAWRGFRGVRDNAIRAGGQDARTLFAALNKHAAIETSPLVAAVIVDILHLEKSTLTNPAFSKAFDANFNSLVAMLKTCGSRLAAGDGTWARPCTAALPILKDADEFYKPDTKKATAILQQLVNVAQAAAKAYAAKDGTGATAFQCTPLLQQVEDVISSLTKDDGKDIRGPLSDRRMSAKEKSTAIRRGVLEWVDRLEELGVKEPVFTPVKKPTPTTAPTKAAA